MMAEAVAEGVGGMGLALGEVEGVGGAVAATELVIVRGNEGHVGVT